jgi:hypothetical protein
MANKSSLNLLFLTPKLNIIKINYMVESLEKLPLILQIPLFGWLIVSPIVFIRFFWDIGETKQFIERHEIIMIAVIIGATLSLFIILFLGIERFLVFIPSDLGFDDNDGYFISIKYYTALILALCFSYFFIHVLYKFKDQPSEYRRIKIVEEIEKLNDESCNYSREFLLEKQEEAKDQFQSLAKLSYPSAAEEMEMEALENLLDELECQIQENELSSKTSSSVNKNEDVKITIKEEPLQPTESKLKPTTDKKNLPEPKKKTQLEDMYAQLELHDIENMRLMGHDREKDI